MYFSNAYLFDILNKNSVLNSILSFFRPEWGLGF